VRAFPNKPATPLFGTPRAEIVANTDFRQRFVRVFYRCEIEDMFASNRKEMKAHTAAKKRKEALSLKAVGPIERRPPVTVDRVKRAAMEGHLSSMMVRGQIISVDTRVVSIETTSSSIHVPLAKRRRESNDQMHEAGPDIDNGGDSAESDHSVFIEMVWRNIGKKRRIATSVAAGGRLRDADDAVYVYPKADKLNQDVEGWLVSGASDQTINPSYIFSGFTLDANVDTLMATTRRWASHSVWTVSGMAQRAALSDVLSNLRTSAPLQGFRPRSEDDTMELRTLQECGIAHEDDSGSWRFTLQGLSKVTLSKQVVDPQPMFQLRDSPYCFLSPPVRVFIYSLTKRSFQWFLLNFLRRRSVARPKCLGRRLILEQPGDGPSGP
jgi:hypothetical protein